MTGRESVLRRLAFLEAAVSSMTAAGELPGGPAHRISSDYGPAGDHKKGGARKVASKAGEKRYGLPIGTPLGQTKSKAKGDAATKRSYETFMAANTATDQRNNARWMSTDELGRTAEALFSFESKNARDESARSVLVKELADRGVDPATFGYRGAPVVVNPNPKEDPTVKAVRLDQKKADTDAARQQRESAAAQKKAEQEAAAKKKKAEQEKASQQAAQALIDGKLVRRASAVTAAFNPSQPRDKFGRWIEMGAFVHFSQGLLGKKRSGQVVGVDKSGRYRVRTQTGESLIDGGDLEVVNTQARLTVVPDLDQQTQSLINQTDQALGRPSAPVDTTPEVPAAPAAASRKSGGELKQGDKILVPDASGKKLALTVDGVATKEGGHTVTATDKGGQQYQVSMSDTDTVQVELPPLTDKEFADHTAAVERVVGQALKDGLATEAQFSLDGKGEVWTPERAKLHNEIVAEVWAKAQNVPNEGLGLFSGGLGGAGKTTTLGNPKTGIDQSQYLTINPDDIKEILAKKGMVPDVPGAEIELSPMEKVALIHEESSHIANLLAQRAYAEKKNVTWDITMASEGSVAKRIAEMKAKGYGEMQAVFVDIPVEKSVERAMSRYQRGMEDHRNGKGDGGRYVPPSVIRKNVSTSFSSANRMNFEALRDQFDNWQVWDNSVDGREPRLVYSKMSTDLARLTEEARAGQTDNDRQAVAA